MPDTDQPVDLARCDEHDLVQLPEPDGSHLIMCPACEFPDVEVRLDTEIGDHLSHHEFTDRLEWETVTELVPLMQEYLEDREQGPLWFTHFPWEDDAMPAGYTEQERFVFAMGYKWEGMAKHLIRQSNAVETAQTLREEGYGDD